MVHFIRFIILGATCAVALQPALASDRVRRSISAEERETRVSHARELLGKHYDGSVVLTGEQIQKINNMIYRWTFQSLPERFKSRYQEIAQAIIDESFQHGFDPVFVLAVISHESGFVPTRRGRFGEIGLMQLKPSTGRWISEKMGWKWKGKFSLKNPLVNIKLGTAYLAYLRERFDSHARLYVSAYNMGQGNVDDALDRKIWPKEYALKVMKQYYRYYMQLEKIALDIDSPGKNS